MITVVTIGYGNPITPWLEQKEGGDYGMGFPTDPLQIPRSIGFFGRSVYSAILGSDHLEHLNDLFH